MALREQHQDDFSAIFSPSVARVAASTAKDWAYVDSWLAAQFAAGGEGQASPVPRFERNPATLAVLLAVANANEAADDSNTLLAGAEKAALQALRHQGQQQQHHHHHHHRSTDDGDSHPSPSSQMALLREKLLSRIAENLTQEGAAALEALSQSAASLGISYPRCQDLCERFMSQQVSLFENQQAIARVDALRQSLAHEVATSSEMLAALRDDKARLLPPEMPRDNVELQRKTRAKAEALSDNAPEPSALPSRAGGGGQQQQATIKSVLQQERRLLAAQAEKRRLDKHLDAFAGLSSDPQQARRELMELQQQLDALNAQRDQVFEDLVEQASPVKASR
ncbi:hypothetical protein AAL_05815 [Moelleriella libera RCEF 2490]|uniref:Uncharacterized protein n=1 Tax=Moelleriella libera RCEF 2490 TaxID=1081109 RepID=A0A166NZ59_9HYPO|nr:hypothetical protein AAL_05815 [Moelleriella libera RCEF 2490]